MKDGEPMILMVGVGHVFRIAETVSFIVKNVWPQAVLVELDGKRYDAIMKPTPKGSEIKNQDLPKSYRRAAKYQNRMASQNDTETGGEMVAAVQTANVIGADVVCIDRDAQKVMQEMEDEMSFAEKARYGMSTYTDNLFGKKKIEKTQKDFSLDEKAYIDAMRKKYPTFVRKLIDERNTFMAGRIRTESLRYSTMVIFVGDAHVEGICEQLPDLKINKIRLAELIDPDKLEKVKDAIWNDEIGKKGE
ncbi:MAG: TraB/GumN family protein [Candidatus Methanomethylophilaceae archaeon]|jgi:pheromone shutdown protein TraB